jgi:uncharacterized protein (TIGR02246 family)
MFSPCFDRARRTGHRAVKPLFLMASAVGVLAVAPAAAQSGASVKNQRCAPVTTAAVERQFDLFNQAWATKNPDRVKSLFAPDAVLLATVSNEPRTTPGAIRDYFVGFLKASPVGRIETSTVRLGCNTASRVGTWTVTLTNPETGGTTDVKARYSFIYKYQGGRWWIDHLHSSRLPEA